MRKKLASVLVFVGLVAVTGFTVPSQAQTKKTAKATGSIEIRQGKDEKFRFFVLDNDEKLVAMSSPRGYETEAEAKKGIEEMKEIVASAKISMKKASKTEEKEEKTTKKGKKGTE
jgi:uncharacterized protein YegP (UPF0339 family)